MGFGPTFCYDFIHGVSSGDSHSRSGSLRHSPTTIRSVPLAKYSRCVVPLFSKTNPRTRRSDSETSHRSDETMSKSLPSHLFQGRYLNQLVAILILCFKDITLKFSGRGPIDFAYRQTVARRSVANCTPGTALPLYYLKRLGLASLLEIWTKLASKR